MNAIKSAVVFSALLAATAAIVAGVNYSAATHAQAALATLNAQHRETTARISVLENQLESAGKRAQAVEADNAMLADALKKAQAAKAAAPVTREAVEERFKRAQQLARGGDPAEALRELLWCQDGYRRLGGSMMSRASMVVMVIGKLGENYPEALAALREQRDALRRQVVAGPGGADAVSEFSAVLRALKDDQAMLDLYDAVPAGDRRRTSLGIYAFEELLTAKRYTDAVAGRSYASMSSSFEMSTAERQLPPSITNPERVREASRNYAIQAAGKNIEALAGAGDVAHAHTLINRLVAYDNSESTAAMLRERLARAGHPELLASAPKP